MTFKERNRVACLKCEKEVDTAEVVMDAVLLRYALVAHCHGEKSVMPITFENRNASHCTFIMFDAEEKRA